MEPRHLIYHPVLSILNMKPEFKKMQNLQCFIAQSSCLSCYKNEIPVVFSHEECSSCERSWVKPLMHLILETIQLLLPIVFSHEECVHNYQRRLLVHSEMKNKQQSVLFSFSFSLHSHDHHNDHYSYHCHHDHQVVHDQGGNWW